jgi:hypothetical protein
MQADALRGLSASCADSLNLPNDRNASISTELSYPRRVRSAPDSDRRADVPVRQLRTRRRLSTTANDNQGSD